MKDVKIKVIVPENKEAKEVAKELNNVQDVILMMVIEVNLLIVLKLEKNLMPRIIQMILMGMLPRLMKIIMFFLLEKILEE